MSELFSDEEREEETRAPLVTDGDGAYIGDAQERMMSVEELKQEMFKSLRDTGTIEAIRAQLRRRFIEKLKRHGQRQTLHEGADNNALEEREKWTTDDHVVHGLIHEYLERHGMEHTLAVFVPELGGSQQWLPRDAIAKMLRLPPITQQESKTSNQEEPKTPLLAVLLTEMQRRMAVTTMASATQTAMDCHDHRLALENQLRRVENSYLAESATHKQDQSVKSFEERVLRYQREYDELCEKRLEQDLERFKATEIALLRVEERKKFDRELETMKHTMFQEHRERLQRLQDRDRELEMLFAARKTELESSLFEARQKLFQELESLRTKQHDLDAKASADARQFTMETKRLQLLEEKVTMREQNLESAVDGILQEKDKAWQLEKIKWQSEARDRDEQLALREQDATKRIAVAQQTKQEMKELRVEMVRLESELVDAQNLLAAANKTITKLEAEKKMIHGELTARDDMLSEDKHSMRSLSYENARLSAELKTIQLEKARLEDTVVENVSQTKQLESEVKDLQHQLITLKLAEATAVVEERNKLMRILENERSDARWKENDLVGKLLELQTQLAESEATREKYQTQYDDEKVHVESLRHEVSSLHTLLAQAQSAVTTKQQQHDRGRGASSSRTHHLETSEQSASERMLMRMMEMMTMQMQANGTDRGVSGRGFGGNTGGATAASTPAAWHATVTAGDTVGVTASRHPTLAGANEGRETNNKEDLQRLKLKAEQERLERELLEQREYERRKQAREDDERLELEQRRKKFDDDLERERLERIRRDQEMDDDRRRRAAEQEARLSEELQRQQKAIEEARDQQKKLLDEQIALEQRRLQEERLRDEEKRARVAQEDAEVAARRLQQYQVQVQVERKEQESADQNKTQQRQQEDDGHAGEAVRQVQTQQEEKRRDPDVAVPAPSVHDQEESSEQLESHQLRLETTVSQVGTVSIAQRSRVNSDTDHFGIQATESEPTVDDHHLEAAVEEPSDAHGDPKSDDESYHSESERSVGSNAHVRTTTSDNGEAEDHAANIVVGGDTVDASADRDNTHEPLGTLGNVQAADAVSDPPQKSEQELEEERRQTAEATKKQEDEAALDVYRQRVLARRAAEKQRQQEMENQAKREEEERAAAALASLQADGSDDELDHSGGSFASSTGSGI